MVTKDDGFQRKLLATFKAEAAEHVQALSSGLIELEKAPAASEQSNLVELVFREAHSLKGAARAVGAREIESICQSAESVFSALKRGEFALSRASFDVLYEALDALGRLCAAVGMHSSAAGTVAVAQVVGRLEALLADRGTQAQADAADGIPPARTAPEPSPRPAAALSAPADTVRIATAKLDALLFQAEELLAAKLNAQQRAAEIREAANTLSARGRTRSESAAGDKALERARWEEAERPSAGAAGDPKSQRLRDSLQRESAFARSFSARLAALAASAERDQRTLGAMVDGLLEDMKKTLMLPVSSALENLPKLVRDLSREQGKEVELAMRGAEIEIDRRILEQMRDPLMHLARNCVDHGIEPPAERERAGKPARGNVALTVTRTNGSRVEIVLSDDGAGIDSDKVLASALGIGALAREEAATRDPRERLALVFRSGVTTSPIVTGISGRGLGLAIVRDKVERLGGSVAVQSEPGRGTTFRLALPLTLATFRGTHVQAGGQRFVLPTIHIEQALRVKGEAVKTAENRETVRWRGQALALVRLAEVLELPRGRAAAQAGEFLQLVVLGSAGRRIAFAVDEVLEEREVLVKPLGEQLSRVRNVAGATVLGTGKVVLVLDVPDLLKSAVKTAAAPAAAPERGPTPAARARSVLVAEDSITARTLLKNILESAGYRVRTALDGVDALTQLKSEAADLVVSDVDMPRMNGFDLTARIRADPALAALPVVLVTALETREHRERGIDVGANAYIVKSSFDQSNLLEALGRLL